MPRQNRVTPFGLIEASPARGLLMGNRGILQDAQGRLGSARWRHRAWIACLTAFKDRRRPIMAPGRYTELFFLDEAVAFAAGHRPCAECRRANYRRFGAAWRRAHGLASDAPLKADEIDRVLHAARLSPDRRQARIARPLGALPDGAFAVLPEEADAAWLVWEGGLHRWTHAGYDGTRAFDPTVEAVVLTPEPTLRALAAGYRPVVHPSAGGQVPQKVCSTRS